MTPQYGNGVVVRIMRKEQLVNWILCIFEGSERTLYVVLGRSGRYDQGVAYDGKVCGTQHLEMRQRCNKEFFYFYYQAT